MISRPHLRVLGTVIPRPRLIKAVESAGNHPLEISVTFLALQCRDFGFRFLSGGHGDVVLRIVRNGSQVGEALFSGPLRPGPPPIERGVSALTPGTIYSMTSPLDSIVVALKRQEIIPDVIPSNFTPTLLFSIVYPAGCEVTMGNTLLREDTLDEPDVVISPMNLPFANADSTGEGDDLAKEVSYTLVMTDPDAPSRADPKYRQSRHWLVRITNSVELCADILRFCLRD